MLDILDAGATEPKAKKQPFRQQIGALEVGESACKATRLKMESEEARDLTAFIRKFRISIDSEVSKQRKNTAREFVVEQGTVVCNGGHVLVVVCVTRIEPEETDL